jgi:hypothetical protein
MRKTHPFLATKTIYNCTVGIIKSLLIFLITFSPLPRLGDRAATQLPNSPDLQWCGRWSPLSLLPALAVVGRGSRSSVL